MSENPELRAKMLAKVLTDENDQKPKLRPKISEPSLFWTSTNSRESKV